VSRRSASLRWAVRLVVPAVLLGWLVSRTDTAALGQAFARVSWWALPVGVGFLLVQTVFLAAKWRALLPEVGLWALVRLILIGHFFGTVLPGQISAEVAKAVILSRSHASPSAVTASVAVDRLTGMFVQLGLGAVGAVLATPAVPSVLRVSLVAAVLGIAVVTFLTRIPGVLSLAERVATATAARVAVLARLSRFALATLREVDRRVRHPASLLANVAWGLPSQAAGIAAIYALCQASGVPLSLPDQLWTTAIVSVLLMVPVSLAGFGVREVSFVGMLALRGIAREQALVLSLGLGGLQIAVAVVGAVVYLIERRATPASAPAAAVAGVAVPPSSEPGRAGNE